MSLFELLLLAVGLSMDAFAVSVCKGLAMDRVTWGRACIPGIWFGAFQGLMPLLGWLLGARFAGYITAVDHWIAFGLLTVLGVNMLREAREDPEAADSSLSWRPMLAMAVAPSWALRRNMSTDWGFMGDGNRRFTSAGRKIRLPFLSALSTS